MDVMRKNLTGRGIQLSHQQGLLDKENKQIHREVNKSQI